MTINVHEESLIKALNSHSADVRLGALYELSGRYLDRLYVKANYVTGSQTENQDFTHDAFLRAYRHLAEQPKQFSSGSAFEGWLYTILLNLYRDTYRQKAVAVEFANEDEFEIDYFTFQTQRNGQPRPVEAVIEGFQAVQDSFDLVNMGSSLLEPMRWAAVLLSLQGLSIHFIADLIKVPKSSIQRWINESFDLLRLHLAKSETDALPPSLWDIEVPIKSQDVVLGMTMLNTLPEKLDPDSEAMLFKALGVQDRAQLEQEYFAMMVLFPLNTAEVSAHLFLHRRRTDSLDNLTDLRLEYVDCEMDYAWVKVNGSNKKMFVIRSLNYFPAQLEDTIQTADDTGISVIKWCFEMPEPFGKVAMYKSLDAKFMQYVYSPQTQKRSIFHFKVMILD